MLAAILRNTMSVLFVVEAAKNNVGSGSVSSECIVCSDKRSLKIPTSILKHL